MIPISSSTTLSIDKTARLLQNLVDLRNKRETNLPNHILKSVDNLLKAQQKFVKQTDIYLHDPNLYLAADDDDIETVKTIVQIHPEFLATQDRNGYLPCNHLGLTGLCTNSFHKHLVLFAHIGYHHNIGGRDRRGGLLVPTIFDSNTLHLINDSRLFKLLQNHDPPLFYKKDVQTHHLLHNAVENHDLNLVKFLYNLNPSSLHQEILHELSITELPIHCAINRGVRVENLIIVQYLLE